VQKGEGLIGSERHWFYNSSYTIHRFSSCTASGEQNGCHSNAGCI